MYKMVKFKDSVQAIQRFFNSSKPISNAGLLFYLAKRSIQDSDPAKTEKENIPRI